jgi:hypothetical protein
VLDLHRSFVDIQQATIVKPVRLRDRRLFHKRLDSMIASYRPDQLINLHLYRRDAGARRNPWRFFARDQSPAAVKCLKGWIVLNALQAAPATSSPIASITRSFGFGVISLLSKS